MMRDARPTLLIIALAPTLWLGCSPAGSRQDKTPPTPQIETATLEQTMQWLLQDLSAIGRVNFTLHLHDAANGESWVNKFSPEVSSVRTDTAGCRIDYDWRWFRDDGQLKFEQHPDIALKEVGEIDVLPAEEATREMDAKEGNAHWTARADPPVFVVKTSRAAATENNFPFYDEAKAARVARELAHAVELCGGHALLGGQAKALPPPNAKANLEATLNWIARELEGLGAVNYVVYRHVDRDRGQQAAVIRGGLEITRVQASAAACRMDWHDRSIMSGQVSFDGPVALPLKQVRQVEVMPLEQFLKEEDHRARRPAATYRVVPRTYAVVIIFKRGDHIYLRVQDSALASELASTLQRAVEACGGGMEVY